MGKARNEAELADAIEKAFLHDDKLVLEEGIDGMEVECAVLGNEKPKASTVGEVVPCNDFYDYEAKYIAADSELHIPARLPADTLEAVRAAACRVFTEMAAPGLHAWISLCANQMARCFSTSRTPSLALRPSACIPSFGNTPACPMASC